MLAEKTETRSFHHSIFKFSFAFVIVLQAASNDIITKIFPNERTNERTDRRFWTQGCLLSCGNAHWYYLLLSAKVKKANISLLQNKKQSLNMLLTLTLSLACKSWRKNVCECAKQACGGGSRSSHCIFRSLAGMLRCRVRRPTLRPPYKLPPPPPKYGRCLRRNILMIILDRVIIDPIWLFCFLSFFSCKAQNLHLDGERASERARSTTLSN